MRIPPDLIRLFLMIRRLMFASKRTRRSTNTSSDVWVVYAGLSNQLMMTLFYCPCSNGASILDPYIFLLCKVSWKEKQLTQFRPIGPFGIQIFFFHLNKWARKRRKKYKGQTRKKSREVATNFLLISQQINIIKEEFFFFFLRSPTTPASMTHPSHDNHHNNPNLRGGDYEIRKRREEGECESG